MANFPSRGRSIETDLPLAVGGYARPPAFLLGRLVFEIGDDILGYPP